eukprot:CAMPEP_0180137988 /NCGR_PEP_ID=MMETSP0986-20121125/12582_1 /TAXON_ID=697907 /ORGANISM="non described non described, Strain CCMP2293" /LENGTH=512 /DNA_ID=CAMNT_0022079639 /DNA_START=117 /DNA_END=1655 /DNA_ORIENTATION=+
MSQRPARLLGVGLISLALAAPTGSAFSPPAAVGTAHGHASLFAGSSAARSLSCMGRRNVCAVRLMPTMGMPMENGAPSIAVTEAGKVRIDSPVTKNDPIALVRGDMSRLKRKIKEVIEKKMGSGEATHPALKSSATEFFERPEKTWRPMAALLFSQALAVNGTAAFGTEKAHVDAMVIAEIIEIMHTATVIHDTVLEDFDSLEKGNAAHRLYSSSMAGNKISILAGDFLLSRASVLLSSLRNTEVVEIMALALEAIMLGQMQLIRPVDQVKSLSTYMDNISVRTGFLLGSGCQCVALARGYTRDSDVAKAAYEYGLNLGTAYQAVKDLRVTEKNLEKLVKKLQSEEQVVFDVNELNEPLQRAGPLFYAAERHPELQRLAKDGFQNLEELLSAQELMVACKADAAVRQEAANRGQKALDALGRVGDALPPSAAREALENLARYVVDPSQARLQRIHYDSSGVYTTPVENERKTGTQVVRALRSAKQSARISLYSLNNSVSRGVKKIKESFKSL